MGRAWVLIAPALPGCSSDYFISFNITGNEHLDGAIVIVGIAIFAVIILWQLIRR